MRNTNNSQKTITSALQELGAALAISEADFGGTLKQAAFADRCMYWNAAELEEAMSAVGACCAMVRTREGWSASEQGRITMAEPLVSIEKIGDGDPSFSGDPNGASKLDWSVFAGLRP